MGKFFQVLLILGFVGCSAAVVVVGIIAIMNLFVIPAVESLIK